MTNAPHALSPVIERVQKLLSLAKSANNEHEAASAAQRAADLMAKHELSEAELQLSTGQARAVEGMHEALIDKAKERRVAWKSTIASGVANAYGCHMFWRAASICVFGRLSATQAVSYTCLYLWAEVERLTDEAWAKTGIVPSKRTTKAWKNAFRVGAANAIAGRLWHETRVRKAAVKTALNMEATLGQLSNTSQALMVVDQKQEEVDTAYERMIKGFRKGTAIGRTSRRDAYERGRAAGETVAIGVQRAGLKRGTEVLG
jgi:hypothetical protein